MIIIGPSSKQTSVEAYTSLELQRIFREGLGIDVPTPTPDLDRIPAPTSPGQGGDAIVLGTRGNNAALRQLLESGFLPGPTHSQGYSMRAGPFPGNPGQWLLAIAGTDAAGTLYALRDLEHYHLSAFRKDAGRLSIEPFERQDYPRIEHRGHWIWGCNMPDPEAWIDNMSRWKLNELIHWDNEPPVRAGEIVAFAHERGVRVVWGFGWGWCPDWNFSLPADFDHGRGEGVQMCGSSEANLRFFREGILRKVREDYAPTGCDGLYFQAFTECPKCQCPSCAGRTMGELMLRFVNPIVDAIKREFPDLWISCGIHHDFGDFSFLRELDPRCNLLWENCASGTSLRGEDEDFGYIYKSIPYGAGYGKTCSADPDYTEESLREWMQSNARNYRVEGGLESHYRYMSYLQKWGRGVLGKRSVLKHASVVADHAVFCRRTPFPHAALAEAQWNPGLDTKATVDGLLAFLGLKAEIERTPEPGRPIRDLEGKPPWLCDPDALSWARDAWSSSG
jgi:hypothetical protein